MSPLFLALSTLARVLRNCLITPRPLTKYGPYAGGTSRNLQAFLAGALPAFLTLMYLLSNIYVGSQYL